MFLDPADQIGPTDVVVSDFSGHIQVFKEDGGVVYAPPHPYATRLEWVAMAKSYREQLAEVEHPDRRLVSGLSFLWHAVQSPCCLVAHARGELVAALEYRIRPLVINVEGVGSRQAVMGAAWALEFELARQAARHQLPVRATFLPDARGFHRRIGRRLGQPTYYTSAWTLADCRFIVDRVTALLT